MNSTNKKEVILITQKKTNDLQQKQNKVNNQPKKYRKRSVAFPVDLDNVICRLSEQHAKPVSAIYRVAVENHLADYLGNIEFLDHEQGKQVLNLKKRLILSIIELNKTIERIRFELNRIGINYNQEIKMKNIEEKYRNLTDIDSQFEMLKEIEELTKGSSCLSKDELDSLIKRFEDAAKKIGDEIACILE